MNFHRGFRQYVWVRRQELDGYRSPSASQEDVDAVFNPQVPKDIEGLKFFATISIQAYLANQAGREKEEDYQTPQVFNEAIKWLEGMPRRWPLLPLTRALTHMSRGTCRRSM
jgi:hypothetical protein